MTPGTRGPDIVLRPVVNLVRRIARRRFALSAVGLVAVVAVAGGNVAVTALQGNPLSASFAVRVLLPESGGLMADQNVTVRGIPVGHVESLSFTGDGVDVVARIDGGTRIPQDSPLQVSALSAAGEQFLDFRPDGAQGPFLSAGSIVTAGRGSVPVSLAQLLQNARGVAAQLDTKRLSAVMTELRVSRQGPEKLAAILDGGMFMVSTLDSVLPQTVSVLRNSRVVLATVADGTSGVEQTTRNLSRILRGVDAIDGGFRTLVDRGSGQLATVDTFIDDNRASAVALLGNLTTVSQVLYTRLPALEALFPPGRGSLLDALTSTVHDGGLWGVGDIYPRYGCDYGLPRRPSAQPDFVEPHLYTYCANPDPAVLVRGARNAPRPPGEEDTSGPPPGYDPLAQTTPTPIGPHTIATPYGGPALPAVIPP